MARVDYKDMIHFAREIQETYKLFDQYELVPLEQYQGMDTRPAWEFKTPMAHGFYRAYTIKGMEKIEKITIGELHYLNRAKYCVLNMTASDEYDLPIFACEYDETAPRLGITIDLMPLVDIGVHHWYREKYLDLLAPIWQQYRTLPGFTKEGRCLVQRRYAPWPWARSSLSPYSLDGRIEEPEARRAVMEAVVAYAQVWLKLMDAAEPITDLVYKQEMLTRKHILQRYYRERDPGGEVLKKIFGEEKYILFVTLVF